MAYLKQFTNFEIFLFPGDSEFSVVKPVSVVFAYRTESIAMHINFRRLIFVLDELFYINRNHLFLFSFLTV